LAGFRAGSRYSCGRGYPAYCGGGAAEGTVAGAGASTARGTALPGYTAADAECFTYKFIWVRRGAANTGKVFFLTTGLYTIDVGPLFFQESLFSDAAVPGKAAVHGKAGRFEAIEAMGKRLTARPESREGRNLLDVLEAASIPEAMAILQARCNNGAGQPTESLALPAPASRQFRRRTAEPQANMEYCLQNKTGQPFPVSTPVWAPGTSPALLP
jgi:hypothetical protein